MCLCKEQIHSPIWQNIKAADWGGGRGIDMSCYDVIKHSCLCLGGDCMGKWWWCSPMKKEQDGLGMVVKVTWAEQWQSVIGQSCEGCLLEGTPREVTLASVMVRKRASVFEMLWTSDGSYGQCVGRIWERRYTSSRGMNVMAFIQGQGERWGMDWRETEEDAEVGWGCKHLDWHMGEEPALWSVCRR